MSLQNMLDDLVELEPFIIQLPSPSLDESLSPESKFTLLYHHLQRASRLKQRQLTLYYAFLLGKFIETLNSRPQKSHFKSQITTHFFQGCIRTYYIFLNVGVEQIFRTKLINFVMIKKMKSQDYRTLSQEYSNFII